MRTGFTLTIFLLSSTIFVLIASMTIQPEQSFYGWVLLAALWLLSLSRKRHGLFLRTLCFILSIFLALRYILFRMFFTLQVEDQAGFLLGIVLFSAELYCFFLYIINLFVNIQQVSRPILPLPEKLPTIDVFIPTYDENEDVAYTTALACKNFDYPPELVNIYILNDGSRLPRLNNPEIQEKVLNRHKKLRDLAARAGVHYLTREDGIKAKAGMLNAAIMGKAFTEVAQKDDGTYTGINQVQTSGELILILDCDHIPSKNFLHDTVGHFTNEKLFLLQTPHFMINPDPMRKNTGAEDIAPCESWLFYQGTQRGLDRWGGSYFCGSAAILRRSMIMEIGGICGDTITEDAETALELHSKGYESVYLDKPMVAGLAPESFDAMIRQRIRWCQGMVQIIILKNPAFRKGLTIAQRICYLNSCLYWFFPLSRSIFTLAPLCFLFFGINIYNASLSQVVDYAGPYMVANSILFFYIFGKKRLFLQSEISEMLQAFFLLPAIIAVFISPKKPSFATTPKGLTSDKDAPSPRTTTFLFFFILIGAGFIKGVYLWFANPLVHDAIWLTMFWNSYNFLLILCCLGVVWERKQKRLTHRFVSRDKVTLNGIQGELLDLSASGFSLRMAAPPFKQNDIVNYETEGFSNEAHIVRVTEQMVAGEFINPQPQSILAYIYNGSNRWSLVFDSIVESREAYFTTSLKTLRLVIKTSTLSLKSAVTSKFKIFMTLFICLLLADPAQVKAEQSIDMLDQLMSAENYKISSPTEELRIPFYLPERYLVVKAVFAVKYSRSSTLKSKPADLSLTIDGVSAVSKTTGGPEGATTFFELPLETLQPGMRIAVLKLSQPINITNTTDLDKNWTNFDLKGSYLELDYELRPLGNNNKNMSFIFNSHVRSPKKIYLLLDKFDSEHIKRAVIAVQNIAIRLVERPLQVSLADMPPDNEDCLFIGDSFQENTTVNPASAVYARLTERDLGGSPPFRKTVLHQGGSMTFNELGLGNSTFRRYSTGRETHFMIPSATRLAPNRKLRLSLNLAYSSGMPPGASLDIFVNQSMFANVRLKNAKGEMNLDYHVDVPTSQLINGNNILKIKPHLTDGLKDPNLIESDDLFVTVFGSSSLTLPNTGTYVRIPELRNIFTDGYPFMGASQIYLMDDSYPAIEALLNFGGLIAQKRGKVGQDIKVLIGVEPKNELLTENGATVFKIDPKTPADSLILDSSLIPGTRNGVILNITAGNAADLLKGSQKLLDAKLQEKIEGTGFQISLTSNKVAALSGPTIILSDFPPIFYMSYYANNYPHTTLGIVTSCLLFYSILIWIALKRRKIG